MWRHFSWLSRALSVANAAALNGAHVPPPPTLCQQPRRHWVESTSPQRRACAHQQLTSSFTGRVVANVRWWRVRSRAYTDRQTRRGGRFTRDARTNNPITYLATYSTQIFLASRDDPMARPYRKKRRRRRKNYYSKKRAGRWRHVTVPRAAVLVVRWYRYLGSNCKLSGGLHHDHLFFFLVSKMDGVQGSPRLTPSNLNSGYALWPWIHAVGATERERENIHNYQETNKSGQGLILKFPSAQLRQPKSKLSNVIKGVTPQGKECERHVDLTHFMGWRLFSPMTPAQIHLTYIFFFIPPPPPPKKFQNSHIKLVE